MRNSKSILVKYFSKKPNLLNYTLIRSIVLVFISNVLSYSKKNHDKKLSCVIYFLGFVAGVIEVPVWCE